MTEFFLVLGLIVTGILVVNAAGRTSAVSFFVLLNVVQALTALVLSLTGSRKEDFRLGNVFFSAMPLHGISKAMIDTLLFFLSLNIIALASVIIAYFLVKHRQIGSYSELIGRALVSKGGVASTLTSPTIFIVLIPLYILSGIHYAALDHALLWENQSYLTIKTPEDMGLTNPVLSIYHVLLRLVGLVCIILLEVNIRSKSYLIGVFCVPIIFYALFLMTAGNSRWIPLYFFAWCATRVIVYGRFSFLSFVLALAGIFSFVMVINGRSADTFGVSQITTNIQSVNINDFGTYTAGIWVNVFEGGLNVANSYLLKPTFSDRYQWGSISPLPSLIDGFDQFRDSDKKKFAPHVPMGGFGEVSHFSLGIKILFFCVLGGMLTLLQAVNRRGVSITLLIVNIFCCYVFYLLGTYSLRTSWRYVVIVLFLTLVIYIKGNISAAFKRNKLNRMRLN